MVNVYFTVDVECSMGDAWLNPALKPVRVERAILGKKDNQRYGIPLIMDILEASGLRGVFFVEVFAACNVGERELGAAYQEIVRRGHDVQLHLHPTHYFYNQVKSGRMKEAELALDHDFIGTHPLEGQENLLRMGMQAFQSLTGRTPQAFRAGNYGANLTTLKALENVGIFLDSSYNAAYVGRGCMLPNGTENEGWNEGRVREMPVTVFQTGAWPSRGLKPLEISSISFSEARNVLEQAVRLKMPAVTAILHSFSLFKIADRQYSDIKPDRVVIGRLERLCRWLASRKEDFRVGVFSEPVPPLAPPSAVPSVGAFQPIMRKIVQAVNRVYW